AGGSYRGPVQPRSRAGTQTRRPAEAREPPARQGALPQSQMRASVIRPAIPAHLRRPQRPSDRGRWRRSQFGGSGSSSVALELDRQVDYERYPGIEPVAIQLLDLRPPWEPAQVKLALCVVGCVDRLAERLPRSL